MPLLGAFCRWSGRPLLVAGFLLAPAAIVSFVLALTLRASLFDCVPDINDEVHYWIEIAGFARAGFNTGYFVPSEQPAPLKQIHFGPHGPAFPMIYGSVARVVGWQPASGPFFNIGVLVFGGIVWTWCCRPTASTLRNATFLMMTFWPCVLWVPATMQESLHYAIALILAGLAHQGVNTTSAGARSHWLFLLAVAMAALVRVTWILVLIPWWCAGLRGISWKARLALLCGIAVIVPSVVLTWRMICAPYDNYLAWVLFVSRQSPSLAAWNLESRFERHVRGFLNPWEARNMQVLLRYEVIAIIVIGGFYFLKRIVFHPSVVTSARQSHSARRLIAFFHRGIASKARIAMAEASAGQESTPLPIEKTTAPDSSRSAETSQPLVFAFLNMAPITLLVLAVYDINVWRDYRVLAPHLLLSLLVCISGSAGNWVNGLSWINLAFLPLFLLDFQFLHSERVAFNVAKISKFADELGALHIGYDPQATPWSNTIFVPLLALDYPLLGLPPGMGASFEMEIPALTLPLKSRYLIATPGRARTLLQNNCHLQWLGNTNLGAMYLNLDSAGNESIQPPPSGKHDAAENPSPHGP